MEKIMISSRKGSKAERELVRIFLESEWQALRIAGSGRMNLAPDIIAGTKGRLLIIECKSSKKPAIYIDHVEANNVVEYAKKIGGEPWYGFRFNNKGWIFHRAEQMLNVKKVLPDSGINFKELIN